MLPRTIALGLVMTAGLVTASLAQSPDYRFVRMTPFEPFNTPVPTSVYSEASLNDSGTVAFTTQRMGTDRAVVVSDGTSLTTVADTAGPFEAFGIPAINSSSQVSFRAILDAGPDAIVFGTEGLITTLSSANSLYDAFGNVTSINDSGTVAFSADIGPNDSSITVFDGSAFTSIEDETGSFGFFANPAINSSGQVVYVAVADEIIGGIRNSALRFFDGSSVATIADNSGAFDAISDFSLNNLGDIAYVASLGMGNTALYLFDGLSSQLIADINGPTLQFGVPTLNDAGDIAFPAVLDDGRYTVSTWQEGIINVVISTGDVLEGKTIISSPTGISFARGALNSKGSIAFHAVFTDQTSAVYRADPIEIFSDRFESK